LFCILANHSPESFPSNNSTNQVVLRQIYNKIEANTEKCGIKKIVGFYMAVLEHEWFIILEANSAHNIEHICIDSVFHLSVNKNSSIDKISRRGIKILVTQYRRHKIKRKANLNSFD
jgi:hypothetical protein